MSKYICEECNTPCYLSFDENEVNLPPKYCPADKMAVKWVLISEGEE